jgi:hypothetical protein
MVDILLIQPPIADFYHTAKRTIPYGLASIAAAVSNKKDYLWPSWMPWPPRKSRVISTA